MNEMIELSKGETTRLKIIQAAFDLFVEQGYHGTSMRQIAHRAELALGSIYNHFDSKEAIFITVIDQHHPYHRILPIMLASADRSFAQFLHKAAALMTQAVEDQPGFLNLMFIEFVEFNGEHLHELYLAASPQIIQVLERFNRENQLRKIPPVILLRTFLSMFFAYALVEHFLKPGAGKLIPGFEENALDYMVDIYLHGVLAHD